VTRRRRAAIRLAPVAAAVAAIVPAAVALSDQQAAGQRVLPDLEQETPAGLVVTRHDGHWRLGFRSAARNVGAGPLIIDAARPTLGSRTMRADQVVERTEGPLEVVRNVGRLRYVRSPDHQHWHLLGFDRYELRRSGSRRVLVRDRKTGFCLGDRYAVVPAPPGAPAEPAYTGRCGIERPALLGIREGISAGYGDDYAANLEGQYLPLGRLRAGRYVLVHQVNADRRLRESSYANNAASVLLRLRWRRGVPRFVVLRACPGTDRCAA
jgi:Lysyl oxidase